MVNQVRALLIAATAALGFFVYPLVEATVPSQQLSKYKTWLGYGPPGAAALLVWLLWKPLRVSAEWIAKQVEGLEPGKTPAWFLRSTKGRIDFHRAGKTLQLLRERKQPFSQTLFQGFRASPRWLDNTSGDPGSLTGRSKLTIISGPAGAGKSTLLEIIFPKLQEAADLTALVRHDYVKSALEGDADAIWRGVLDYFRASLITSAELSDAAIAFALDRRRVLLVLDDLHLAGQTKQVMEALKKFFASFNGWREEIMVLATTREPIASNELTGRVCTVSPLTQQKAQELFFSLCRENGVPDAQLISQGDVLSRAFGSEPVRVPLFVAICAYLAVPDDPGNGTMSLDELFHLNRSKVFEAFLQKLYERSNPKPDHNPDEFSQLLGDLAFAVWPVTTRCADDALRTAIRTVTTTAKLAEQLPGFLEANGFLFRRESGGSVWSFPHQAMGDYLAVRAMSRKKNFSGLLWDVPQTMPDVVRLLEEFVVTPEQLEALARDHLRAFTGVLALRPQVQDADGIALSFAEWVVKPTKQLVSIDDWRELAQQMDRAKIDGAKTAWRERFFRLIKGYGESERGILAIAGVGGTEAFDLLDDVLSADKTEGIKRTLAIAPQSSDVLVAFLQKRSLAGEAGAQAFRLLLDMPEKLEDVKGLLREKISAAPVVTVERLIKFGGTRSVELLAEAGKQADVAIRQKIGLAACVLDGRTLVPQGEYLVFQDDKELRVRVNRSLLVESSFTELPGEYHSFAAIDTAIRAACGVAKLMTWHQVLVCRRYFERGEGSQGIMFTVPGTGVYEAFRKTDKSVGLFFSPTRSSAGGGELSPTRGTGAWVYRVVYRRIGYL